MGDLGSMGADQCANRIIGRPTPNRPGGQVQAAHSIDRIIVHAVRNHLMPAGFQQSKLVGHALVLSTRLLVEVVHNEYFHGPKPLLPRPETTLACHGHRTTDVSSSGASSREGINPQTCPLLSAVAW